MRESGGHPHFQNELSYFIFILLHLPYKHHNTSDRYRYTAAHSSSPELSDTLPTGSQYQDRQKREKRPQSLINTPADLQGCFTDNLRVRAFEYQVGNQGLQCRLVGLIQLACLLQIELGIMIRIRNLQFAACSCTAASYRCVRCPTIMLSAFSGVILCIAISKS